MAITKTLALCEYQMPWSNQDSHKITFIELVESLIVISCFLGTHLHRVGNLLTPDT